MKIIFIGPRGISTKYGGIDVHTEKLAYYLSKKKEHDIIIYIRKLYVTSEGDCYRGIKIRKIFTLSNRYLETIIYGAFATLQAIKEYPDIIHYQGASAFFSFIPYFLKIKVVCTIHDIGWKRKRWGKFIKFFLKLFEIVSFKYAHTIIVVSKELENYYRIKHNGDKKIVYIPNAVETSFFLSSQQTLKYNITKDKYILAVGRLVVEKGFHYLIEAYKKVKCDLKLVIAGDVLHSDSYTISLKKMANRNIIFTGHITEDLLTELYSNAYIYVHPSDLEGLSISLLEALSFGNCVLASDIPENKEAIANYGIFFKNKDVEDLSQKLKYLINNKDIVEKIGREARSYVIENFTWQRTAEQTNEIYQFLLKGHKLRKLYKIEACFLNQKRDERNISKNDSTERRQGEKELNKLASFKDKVST